MHALAVVAPRLIAVIQLPEPECGPTDVVVAMRALGLCGSDLSVYAGTTPVPARPWVIGHEGGGVITEVGREVRDRKPGQTVVIEPNICCFKCESCREGRTSSCMNRRALGLTEPGIGAERVSVPAEFCWPVPGTCSSATLAGFEPSVVASSAITRIGVQPGDRCLVVGSGSQGLMLCLRLIALGARPSVVEPHAGRFDLAMELGALPHKEGNSYPIVFESSGAKQAFRPAFEATAPGGQLVLIGQSHQPVEITTREIVQRQITIRGSLIYDHPGDFAGAVDGLNPSLEGVEHVMQARYEPVEVDRACANAGDVAGKSWLDLSSRWTL